MYSLRDGARRGDRTLTPLREPDFESGASTNSAIRAKWEQNVRYLADGCDFGKSFVRWYAICGLMKGRLNNPFRKMVLGWAKPYADLLLIS